MSEVLKGRVGETAHYLITNIRDEHGAMVVGDVLRRTCKLFGEEACAQVCQLARQDEMGEGDTAAQKVTLKALNNKVCSDNNLADALRSQNLLYENVLIVGVTANEVGYGDKLDEYRAAGILQTHPGGWDEIPGFNAFFARAGEVGGLGQRMADCAAINFEFEDASGNTVIGFEHGTRPNMFGESEYRFEREGKKVSYTEYALGHAIDYYGADPALVRIKLAAAIQGHNFTKHFDSREKMERHIPGWYASGYLINRTNPNWREGTPVVESDVWEADSRGMIVDDIRKAMMALGVPSENFNMEGVIDPADTKGVHSSHQFSKIYGETRDLYLTYIPR